MKISRRQLITGLGLSGLSALVPTAASANQQVSSVIKEGVGQFRQFFYYPDVLWKNKLLSDMRSAWTQSLHYSNVPFKFSGGFDEPLLIYANSISDVDDFGDAPLGTYVHTPDRRVYIVRNGGWRRYCGEILFPGHATLYYADCGSFFSELDLISSVDDPSPGYGAYVAVDGEKNYYTYDGKFWVTTKKSSMIVSVINPESYALELYRIGQQAMENILAKHKDKMENIA